MMQDAGEKCEMRNSKGENKEIADFGLNVLS
jgi:hypothetical protein